MTHLAQALEFTAGLVGFFAVIIGLMLWLTHLEQTMHKPRPAEPTKRPHVITTVRAWAKAFGRG